MKQSGSRFRGSLCFCGVKEFAEKTPTAMLRRTLRMQKSGRRARVHTRDELPPPKIPCEERSKKTCTQNAARTGGRAKENSPAEAGEKIVIFQKAIRALQLLPYQRR